MNLMPILWVHKTNTILKDIILQNQNMIAKQNFKQNSRNGIQSQAHAPTQAIVSLGVRLSHALFFVTDLLGKPS